MICLDLPKGAAIKANSLRLTYASHLSQAAPVATSPEIDPTSSPFVFVVSPLLLRRFLWKGEDG